MFRRVPSIIWLSLILSNSIVAESLLSEIFTMHYSKLFLFLYVSSSLTQAFLLSCPKFLNKATQCNYVSTIRERGYNLVDRRELYVSRTLLLRSFCDKSKETSTVEFDLKDRDSFAEFYDATVSFGSSLSLDQFYLHQKVESMLAQRMLDTDDISDVWISLWGCNCKCLTEEEAYQTLCALNNLNLETIPLWYTLEWNLYKKERRLLRTLYLCSTDGSSRFVLLDNISHQQGLNENIMFYLGMSTFPFHKKRSTSPYWIEWKTGELASRDLIAMILSAIRTANTVLTVRCLL